MQFFKVEGKMLTVDQMRKWREEQLIKAKLFCDWCISKATRHTNECPTKTEGFDPETFPKLTLDERESLTKQKDEARRKRTGNNTQSTPEEGGLHDDDCQGGCGQEGCNKSGGNDIAGDAVGERNDNVESGEGSKQ